MALILVDLDGTTANLTRKWFRVLNETFGDHLNPDQPSPVWDVHEISRGGRAAYDILRRPGFFRDLEPYQGAVQALQRIQGAGHEIVIVTDAGSHNFADKRAWVQEHLPFVPKENFIAAARKELVRGDVLVDDAPHVLAAHARLGRPVIAMHRPYNSAVTGCLRANTWLDVEEILFGLFGAPAVGAVGD